MTQIFHAVLVALLSTCHSFNFRQPHMHRENHMQFLTNVQLRLVDNMETLPEYAMLWYVCYIDFGGFAILIYPTCNRTHGL